MKIRKLVRKNEMLARTQAEHAGDLLLLPFQQFARWQVSGGLLLLLLFAAVALVWANSPWASAYDEMLHMPLGISIGDYPLRFDLLHVINDGLMAVFFFTVGLEIKREFLIGELAERRNAMFPIAAAVGEMVVPALIYAAFNTGGEGAHGWGIPMATDIAFALGALAVLGLAHSRSAEGVPCSAGDRRRSRRAADHCILLHRVDRMERHRTGCRFCWTTWPNRS